MGLQKSQTQLSYQTTAIPCRTIGILYIDHEVIENHNSPITEEIEKKKKVKLNWKKGHRS